jgi:hypothetical protein
VVLEAGVSPVTDEQLDELCGFLVAGDEGGEVEGGLAELRLDAVDQGRVGFVQQALDCLEGTASEGDYLLLTAAMKGRKRSSWDSGAGCSDIGGNIIISPPQL